MVNKNVVLTLDAGGTNFVFSAIQDYEQIVDDIRAPAEIHNLDKCMNSIISGFNQVIDKLRIKPRAISFAFPGPADYPNGIIGDLPNLPAFRGGVALGPMLEEKFDIPVFINNDGDLYAYGEALVGFLPWVNDLLEEAGSPKRYKNLLGLTLGTGFGAGIVRDNQLFVGDNSCAAEIWLLRNKLMPNSNIEEHASIRGVKAIYADVAQIPIETVPEPKEIYDISKGFKKGNKNAAVEAFLTMAEAAGDAISNAITLIDGLVVIGGGLSGASDLFLPKIVNEMNSKYTKSDGTIFNRLTAKTYNLEDQEQLKKFLAGSTKEIKVYGSNKKVNYDSEVRIGIGISKIGTSKAISLGAYSYAVNQLGKD